MTAEAQNGRTVEGGRRGKQVEKGVGGESGRKTRWGEAGSLCQGRRQGGGGERAAERSKTQRRVKRDAPRGNGRQGRCNHSGHPEKGEEGQTPGRATAVRSARGGTKQEGRAGAESGGPGESRTVGDAEGGAGVHGRKEGGRRGEGRGGRGGRAREAGRGGRRERRARGALDKKQRYEGEERRDAKG